MGVQPRHSENTEQLIQQFSFTSDISATGLLDNQQIAFAYDRKHAMYLAELAVIFSVETSGTITDGVLIGNIGDDNAYASISAADLSGKAVGIYHHDGSMIEREIAANTPITITMPATEAVSGVITVVVGLLRLGSLWPMDEQS